MYSTDTFREAVILQNEEVVAWHKTPTTSNIQAGVELAIREVVRKGEITPSQIKSVKIGTTVSASNCQSLVSGLCSRPNAAIRQDGFL